jgi:hypothetical protein
MLLLRARVSTAAQHTAQLIRDCAGWVQSVVGVESTSLFAASDWLLKCISLPRRPHPPPFRCRQRCCTRLRRMARRVFFIIARARVPAAFAIECDGVPRAVDATAACSLLRWLIQWLHVIDGGLD